MFSASSPSAARRSSCFFGEVARGQMPHEPVPIALQRMSAILIPRSPSETDQGAKRVAQRSEREISRLATFSLRAVRYRESRAYTNRG